MEKVNDVLTFIGKEIISTDTVFDFLDVLKNSTNDGIFIHMDDIKTILNENDFATLWVTQQCGENPALIGMEQFIETMSIENITGCIFYFSMPQKVSFEKLAVAMDMLSHKIHHDIPILFGTIINEQLSDDTIRLTTITTMEGKSPPIVAVNNFY